MNIFCMYSASWVVICSDHIQSDSCDFSISFHFLCLFPNSHFYLDISLSSFNVFGFSFILKLILENSLVFLLKPLIAAMERTLWYFQFNFLILYLKQISLRNVQKGDNIIKDSQYFNSVQSVYSQAQICVDTKTQFFQM